MEFLARDIFKRRLVTMLRCLENERLGHAARVAAATLAYLEDAKRGDIPCQERLRLLEQMETATCLMWLGAHSAAEVVLRRLHVAPPWAAMGRRLAQARHMTDQQRRAADLGTLDALHCDVLERIQQLLVQRAPAGRGDGGDEEAYAG
jgi:hypothetical protein